MSVITMCLSNTLSFFRTVESCSASGDEKVKLLKQARNALFVGLGLGLAMFVLAIVVSN